jgi:hypothetical protein
MNSDETEMFSAGDCPVCGDSGALIALISNATGTVIVFCPLCEVAWDEPPNGRVDTVWTLKELAPRGAALAKRQQLIGAKLGPFEPVSTDEWLSFLPNDVTKPPAN